MTKLATLHDKKETLYTTKIYTLHDKIVYLHDTKFCKCQKSQHLLYSKVPMNAEILCHRFDNGTIFYGFNGPDGLTWLKSKAFTKDSIYNYWNEVHQIDSLDYLRPKQVYPIDAFHNEANKETYCIFPCEEGADKYMIVPGKIFRKYPTPQIVEFFEKVGFS